MAHLHERAPYVVSGDFQLALRLTMWVPWRLAEVDDAKDARFRMFSLLHISDLHRSAEDPIANDELLESLSTDRARYTKSDPAVRSPDAIIVSGDVIQGVKLGTANSASALRDQYAVAEDFLARLAHDFVNGDRARIVIAPGNHDVDWSVAHSAMRLVPVGDEPDWESIFSPLSDYRWSWKNRRFYKITDRQLYEQRLDAYWDFIERFYAGVSAGT